jgi:hypothetical protein
VVPRTVDIPRERGERRNRVTDALARRRRFRMGSDDLPLDLHGDVEGQSGDADGRARVSARRLTHGNGSAIPPGACIGGRVGPSSFSLDATHDMSIVLEETAL